jgi:hypothetical protein
MAPVAVGAVEAHHLTMNVPVNIKRDAAGRVLPGSAAINPGGRPKGVIEDVRERLGPYTPEFCAALVELVRSPNEMTRLAAIREFFDRQLGKPPMAVDTTVTKDIGPSIAALYLQAVQAANKSLDAEIVDAKAVPDAPAASDW